MLSVKRSSLAYFGCCSGATRKASQCRCRTDSESLPWKSNANRPRICSSLWRLQRLPKLITNNSFKTRFWPYRSPIIRQTSKARKSSNCKCSQTLRGDIKDAEIALAAAYAQQLILRRGSKILKHRFWRKSKSRRRHKKLSKCWSRRAKS